MVAFLEAAGEAGMTLNAADWDGTLNVGGRFSRNSRMNLLDYAAAVFLTSLVLMT